MDTANILILKLAFFLFLPVWTNAQWLLPRPPIAPEPLCASQFALATHACAFLPFVASPPPSPVSPPPPPPPPPHHQQPDYHSLKHRHEHEEEDEGEGEGGHGIEHVHGHGHGHHRHPHHHTHRRRATPVEEECCRWLGAIDTECVCDLLVYLPTFLSRPLHQYTLLVHDSCNVTFLCSSRIRH